MAWSASNRYALAPAPGGLALVQDFLNTRPGPEPDLLATVGSAQAWADEALHAWAETTGRPYRRARLTRPDLAELRRVRAALGAVLRRGEEGADVPFGADVALTLLPDGAVRAEPRGDGWSHVAAALLIEAWEARVGDRWRRLKTCRNPTCPGSFYDRSPNNSGVWHDVTTCGNVANLRAARARKRSAAHP